MTVINRLIVISMHAGFKKKGFPGYLHICIFIINTSKVACGRVIVIEAIIKPLRTYNNQGKLIIYRPQRKI